MSTVAMCPHCGTQLRTDGKQGDDAADTGIGMLSPEVTEAGACRTQEETITALAQEVRQLRETVARLRASSHSCHPQSVQESAQQSAPA